SFATIVSGVFATDLTPASGRQDHTTSPSAPAPFVRALPCTDAAASIASPPNVRDDREAPLLRVQDGVSSKDVSIDRRNELFSWKGLDHPNQIESPLQIKFYVTRVFKTFVAALAAMRRMPVGQINRLAARCGPSRPVSVDRL